MKFNKFLWSFYAGSDRGKSAVSRFSSLTNSHIDEKLRERAYEFCDEFKSQYPSPSLAVDIAELIKNFTLSAAFKNQRDANRYYEKKLVKKGVPIDATDNRGKTETVGAFGMEDDEWYDYIAAISLGLYWAHPDFFLPYDFRAKFNQLEEIHAQFGMPLPPVPGKGDKPARSLYYLAINEAWQEFRQLHGLSPAEMCAFLYDFAPNFVTPLDTTDLPSPSKAWLITGGIAGSWDFDFVDNATEQSVSCWSGNTAVRRGDIVLMYLVRPRRCIHSIWRACSDGFVDPFFHYHGTVWISGCMKTEPVTFTELVQHPLLSKKSAVRAHFQGPSSKTPFTVEEYEAILEMMKDKGQDVSSLPRLPSWKHELSAELYNERDVEVHLIEPLLKRLGYKETDWIRQMPVRMGRGERNYPDYAVGAKARRGEENAKMVLESKYQLSARPEFIDSFYQVKSYALRLQCRVMAMASKEGIWVFPPENGSFDSAKHVHKTWGELSHPDAFHQILCLIGRDKIVG